MTTRQRAEATKRTTPKPVDNRVTITWRGTSFVLPTADDFPLEAMEAEENGKTLTALKLILGNDQYANWRKHAKTAGDAEEFSAHIMRELGPGNH